MDHHVYTQYNLNYPIVPMPNLPKISLILLASLSMLCLNATAQQVYESTDEQGNVTFSDTPSSGSRAVTIEAPNLSDAVKVSPTSSEMETETAPQPQPAASSGEVPADLSTTNDDINNDDDDDGGWLYPDRRYDRKLIREGRIHRRR